MLIHANLTAQKLQGDYCFNIFLINFRLKQHCLLEVPYPEFQYNEPRACGYELPDNQNSSICLSFC